MADNTGLVERLATESGPNSLAQQIVAKMREDAQALTAAEAEIASLKRAHAHELEVAASHITETRAMLAEAVEALEPFARAADFYNGRDEKDVVFTTVHDLRRARSTLTKIKEAGHVAD